MMSVSRYEGFSNNFIVGCSTTIERLGNTGHWSRAYLFITVQWHSDCKRQTSYKDAESKISSTLRGNNLVLCLHLEKQNQFKKGSYIAFWYILKVVLRLYLFCCLPSPWISIEVDCSLWKITRANWIKIERAKRAQFFSTNISD